MPSETLFGRKAWLDRLSADAPFVCGVYRRGRIMAFIAGTLHEVNFHDFFFRSLPLLMSRSGTSRHSLYHRVSLFTLYYEYYDLISCLEWLCAPSGGVRPPAIGLISLLIFVSRAYVSMMQNTRRLYGHDVRKGHSRIHDSVSRTSET